MTFFQSADGILVGTDWEFGFWCSWFWHTCKRSLGISFRHRLSFRHSGFEKQSSTPGTDIFPSFVAITSQTSMQSSVAFWIKCCRSVRLLFSQDSSWELWGARSQDIYLSGNFVHCLVVYTQDFLVMARFRCWIKRPWSPTWTGNRRARNWWLLSFELSGVCAFCSLSSIFGGSWRKKN